MKKRIYFFLSLIILIGCNVKDKEDKVTLLPPQVDVSFKEAGWETEYWSNQESYSDTTFSDSESRVLAIYHDTLQVGRIFKKVEV